MKRIGIMGGTFDPPHLGHLIMAEQVRITLDLNEIWFIPSQNPPHKQNVAAKAEDRIAMLEYAIKSNPAFKLNTIEMKRSGKSYTIDTMKELKAACPETIFYFIIGGDMVEYLPQWHAIDELIQLVTFVGVNRTGYKLTSPYPIIKVDVPIIEISSTMIRTRVANQQSIQYLVTEQVATYIRERGLYGKG